jgi:hypothetical protein
MGLLTSSVRDDVEARVVPLSGYRHSTLSSGFNGSDFYVASTVAHVVDRLYFTPIYVPNTGLIIDRFGVQVTTAVAASLVRYGLYFPVVATGLPGALIEAGTEADCSTTGMKETVSSRTIQRLGGWPFIWGAVVANTATTLTLTGLYGGSTRVLGNMVGDAAVNAGITGCYHAHAYAALPATASAITLIQGDAISPICFVRLAG